MLTIGMVTAQGSRYYTELARVDYYTGGGESPGRWFENSAARGFGVSGEVFKPIIERFFDGFHPKTGEPLAKNHGREDRRAAIDLCLSVPKTVSALWATAAEPRRRELEEAFGRAIDKTLAYVNEQYGYTRRGQGGYEREKVDLLLAKYIHRQSRSQEPQLHAHCLVINAARREDGSLGTIDAGPLLMAKRGIGAYFRSALASELRIPLEPDPKTKFSFRVEAVKQALADRWSSGAARIEEVARERGVEGGKAKAQIALETRRAKDERPLSQMLPEWQETARAYGFTTRDVERIFQRRRPELTPKETQKIIDTATREVIASLIAEQAHFSTPDILTGVWVATAHRGIDPGTVKTQVEETLRQGNFLSLGRHRGQERHTTVEMYHAIEERALEVAKSLGERQTHVVSERAVEKALVKEPRLNDGQREAVRTVCRGPDLTLITGPPGTGKSTLFEVARKAIEKDGANVMGIAPSNRAARELEKNSGITSVTVHRFLYDRERTVVDAAKHQAKMLVRAALGRPTWKQPKLAINRRTTLIIDECVMVNNDMLARTLKQAEKAGCRVVLVGDPRQLPALGPGGLFRELSARAREDQKTELTEIVRQREPWAREAIHQIGRGDMTALQTFEQEGCLHLAPPRDEAERLLVERWKQEALRNPRDHLIIASTNIEVERLNQRVQESVREAGQLGFRSLRVGAERIHEGDRILFTATNKRLGLINSEFATVTHVDMLTRRLTVGIDGQEKPVTFSLRKFDSLRLGYAATTHRAQGMTLDQNVYALVGGGMQSREMTYVQVSRARGSTHLFSDAQHRTELERLVGRSREKVSAHQIAREARPDPPPVRPRQEQELYLSL